MQRDVFLVCINKSFIFSKQSPHYLWYRRTLLCVILMQGQVCVRGCLLSKQCDFLSMAFKLRGLRWNKVGPCLLLGMKSLFQEKQTKRLSGCVTFVPAFLDRGSFPTSARETRDPALQPQRIIQRDRGRMHGAGMGEAGMRQQGPEPPCRRGSWESSKLQGVSPLGSRAPGTRPALGSSRVGKLRVSLVRSVGRSRALEKQYQEAQSTNNDKIENKSCQSPRIYLASSCCVCLFL